MGLLSIRRLPIVRSVLIPAFSVEYKLDLLARRTKTSGTREPHHCKLQTRCATQQVFPISRTALQTNPLRARACFDTSVFRFSGKPASTQSNCCPSGCGVSSLAPRPASPTVNTVVYTLTYGQWSGCSVTCGAGSMTRSKSCLSSSGVVVDLLNCNGDAPMCASVSSCKAQQAEVAFCISGPEEKTTQSCVLPVQCATVFAGLSCAGRSGLYLNPVRWLQRGDWLPRAVPLIASICAGRCQRSASYVCSISHAIFVHSCASYW
jgi:hypothetical protein